MMRPRARSRWLRITTDVRWMRFLAASSKLSNPQIEMMLESQAFYRHMDTGEERYEMPEEGYEWTLSQLGGRYFYYNSRYDISTWRSPGVKYARLESWTDAFSTVICGLGVNQRWTERPEACAAGASESECSQEEVSWRLRSSCQSAQVCHREEMLTGQARWELPARTTPESEDYVIGRVLQIKGLRRRRRFNGLLGSLVAVFDGDMFILRLAWPLLCEVALSSRNLDSVGDENQVIVDGLADRQEFNGRRGMVVGRRSESGTLRYMIDLMDEMKILAVRPEHLLPWSGIDELDLAPGMSGCEQYCRFTDSARMQHVVRVSLPTESVFRPGKQTQRWPLLVYLPDSCGYSFRGKFGTSSPSSGSTHASMDYVIVSPCCEWSWKELPWDWVVQLVERMACASWIDEDRVYLTGYSMGGMGTWEIAARRPDLFAAVAPVASYHEEGRLWYLSRRLKHLPILSVILETEWKSEWPLIEALLNGGGTKLQVEICEEASCHEVADHVYCRNDFLYDWLRKWSRKKGFDECPED